uniref:Uncharacterized protein n=1 Tax=Globodera pallida TaxID=36090 RepID=A0A183C5S4_GLOPA
MRENGRRKSYKFVPICATAAHSTAERLAVHAGRGGGLSGSVCCLNRSSAHHPGGKSSSATTRKLAGKWSTLANCAIPV